MTNETETPLIVRHEEDGRYVALIWSAIADADERCEQCDYSHDETGRTVRTYRDAADVFDLCDRCAMESAACTPIGGNDEPGADPNPDADYVEWADFDTVEQAGHDGTGRGVTSAADVETVARWLDVQRSVGGWHPDTPASDLVRIGDGAPVFDDVRAAEVDALTDAAFAAAGRLGWDVYGLVLDMVA